MLKSKHNFLNLRLVGFKIIKTIKIQYFNIRSQNFDFLG